MKAIFQRVHSAKVSVDGKTVGEIGEGVLIMLGVVEGDTEADAVLLAQKIANLRVFTDENDKLNLSLLNVGGEAMVIWNFTLAADCSHGRRPNFCKAARPDVAFPLYEKLQEELRACGVPKVATGMFGEHMVVEMVGNGPITIPLNTDDWK